MVCRAALMKAGDMSMVTTLMTSTFTPLDSKSINALLNASASLPSAIPITFP